MITFRKPETDATLAAEVERLHKRQKSLAGKLIAAQMGYDQAAAARRNLLADEGGYDDATLAGIDQNVARAQAVSAGARDALKLIEQQIAETERKLAAAKEKRQRAEIVEKVQKKEQLLCELVKAFNSALTKLTDEIPSDVSGTAVLGVLYQSSEALSATFGELLVNMKQYRESIANGSQPLPGHAPPPPPPLKVPEGRPSGVPYQVTRFSLQP